MSWFKQKKVKNASVVIKNLFHKPVGRKYSERSFTERDEDLIPQTAQIPINIHKRAILASTGKITKFYLDDTIVSKICEFLATGQPKTLVLFASVNNTWRKAAFDDKFWKPLYEQLAKKKSVTPSLTSGFREGYKSILQGKNSDTSKNTTNQTNDGEKSTPEITITETPKVSVESMIKKLESNLDIKPGMPLAKSPRSSTEVKSTTDQTKHKKKRRKKPHFEPLQPLNPKPFYTVDWKTLPVPVDNKDHISWIEDKETKQKQLEGATLDRLVEEMTSPIHYDANFLFTVMITFRSFTTREELLQKLIERFNLPPPPGCSELQFARFKKEKLEKVRLRVTQAVKFWLEKFFLFDFDEKMIQKVEQLIDMMDKSQASAYARMLRQTLKRVQEGDTSGVKESVLVCPPIQYPKVFLGLGKKKSKNILDWPALEVARQITLIDFNIFKKIEPKECLNQAWNSKNRETQAPNIAQMIKRFNKLSNWVGSTVVQTTDLDQRIKVVTKFIDITNELKKLNNFNSLFALCSGLGLASVFRLKKTWNGLDDKVKQTFENLRKYVARDLNFKAVRTAIKEVNPPCIPYIGLYLTDLTFVEEGNAKYIEKNNVKLINFVKCVGFAGIIRDMQIYQNTRYALQECKELKELLLDITHLNEKEMYAKSCEIEPKPPSKKKKKPTVTKAGDAPATPDSKAATPTPSPQTEKTQ